MLIFSLGIILTYDRLGFHRYELICYVRIPAHDRRDIGWFLFFCTDEMTRRGSDGPIANLSIRPLNGLNPTHVTF